MPTYILSGLLDSRKGSKNMLPHFIDAPYPPDRLFSTEKNETSVLVNCKWKIQNPIY
jgi:hypothetical protein